MLFFDYNVCLGKHGPKHPLAGLPPPTFPGKKKYRSWAPICRMFWIRFRSDFHNDRAGKFPALLFLCLFPQKYCILFVNVVCF